MTYNNDELEIGLIPPLGDDSAKSRSASIPNERARTHSERAEERALIFSASRLVVGSSNARIPQLAEKDSCRASRMMIEARTFCPAEHRPRMSISTLSFAITTCKSRQYTARRCEWKVTDSIIVRTTSSSLRFGVGLDHDSIDICTVHPS